MGAPIDKILLIHGTGAASDADEGDAWWQRESPFRDRLGELLAERARCDETVFHWSGANSEAARVAAGRRLRRRLRQLEREKTGYHLVGHSHGGSILWHALRGCRPGELTHLRSWTTVGTPFLHFSPRWEEALLAMPVIVCGLAIASLAGSFFTPIDDVVPMTPAVELVLAAGLALLVGAFAATRLLAWLGVIATRRLRTSRDERAFAAFGDRWLGLRSAKDEAIGGLGSSRELDGALLPGFGIAAPLLALGDGLVWSWLRRRLQGADHSAENLAAVSTGPLRGSVAPTLADPDLDGGAIDARLVARADRALGQYAKPLRGVVGWGAATGMSVLEMPLRRTGRRPLQWHRLLVHTTYFQTSDEVAELIATHIDAHATGVPAGIGTETYRTWTRSRGNGRAPTPATEAGPTADGPAGSRSGAAAKGVIAKIRFAAASPVLAALLTLVIVLFWQWGSRAADTLYEYTDAHQVEAILADAEAMEWQVGSENLDETMAAWSIALWNHGDRARANRVIEHLRSPTARERARLRLAEHVATKEWNEALTMIDATRAAIPRVFLGDRVELLLRAARLAGDHDAPLARACAAAAARLDYEESDASPWTAETRAEAALAALELGAAEEAAVAVAKAEQLFDPESDPTPRFQTALALAGYRHRLGEVEATAKWSGEAWRAVVGGAVVGAQITLPIEMLRRAGRTEAALAALREAMTMRADLFVDPEPDIVTLIVGIGGIPQWLRFAASRTPPDRRRALGAVGAAIHGSVTIDQLLELTADLGEDRDVALAVIGLTFARTGGMDEAKQLWDLLTADPKQLSYPAIEPVLAMVRGFDTALDLLADIEDRVALDQGLMFSWTAPLCGELARQGACTQAEQLAMGLEPQWSQSAAEAWLRIAEGADEPAAVQRALEALIRVANATGPGSAVMAGIVPERSVAVAKATGLEDLARRLGREAMKSARASGATTHELDSAAVACDLAGERDLAMAAARDVLTRIAAGGVDAEQVLLHLRRLTPVCARSGNTAALEELIMKQPPPQRTDLLRALATGLLEFGDEVSARRILATVSLEGHDIELELLTYSCDDFPRKLRIAGWIGDPLRREDAIRTAVIEAIPDLTWPGAVAAILADDDTAVVSEALLHVGLSLAGYSPRSARLATAACLAHDRMRVHTRILASAPPLTARVVAVAHEPDWRRNR